MTSHLPERPPDFPSMSDATSPATEEILDPNLPICDAHHHLWDRPRSRYLAEEFLNDIRSGHRVESSVFVECAAGYKADGADEMKPVGETEFADAVARQFAMCADRPRVCAGIVGFADLNLGDAVQAVLDAHEQVTPRFKGIRHCAAWDPSEQIQNAHTHPFERMLASTKFLQGFAELGKRGLSFDAWVFHPQIPEVATLARQFPDTCVVLDHLGGPLGVGPYAKQHRDVLANWKVSMADLSSCPNVMVKLGGIQMPLNGWGFHKRATRPNAGEIATITREYYLTAIDLFGTDRCMFESNYPADQPSATYRTLWDVFKILVRDFSYTEKRALFHDNAVRTYRLMDGLP